MFCDKPNLSTLSKTLEAMKVHASMNGISTIAIPKLGCGLEQMNWQEVVKLLRDIFGYADVQLVVYTLEENGVHALSAEGDAEFYADDEIERCSEEYLLENRELETDEHGSPVPVTYRIQHDDNPSDTCNDFYPIHCQQGNDNKVLRLHNDGENLTLNSLSNEFPSTTIQSATDCFRLGKTINQFRRLCLPSTQSFSSAEGSDPTYSSIDSLNTNEDDDAIAEPHDDDDNPTVDDDEDNFICQINTHANRYRLCKAKAAHDVVLGEINASLAKKPLTATEAPHLDTKSLIVKLDEVARTIDLDVSTILAEQMKHPVLGIVRSWIRKGTLPKPKGPEIQQSKGLLRFCQEFDRLLIEEEGKLLCYNEPTDKLDDENLRNFLPLSLFLACFRLGHYNEMGGHMGTSKTYNIAKGFYYWPGMF